ncbi:30S ribosome-binding factor RbfA [Aliidiomarina maris]|uniref:Ribosome-binding factor A n=1 Tax=Aliidiomarina maris TaxID=531312 RepID=A0A327WY61_9GAMM|nr:30S ribosome-binding factor RbfA [Aliidiomarina maris]MBA3988041.1 30S ribosome-binding factor RbfA [Idiomarina sp.]RAJ96838.1 ribosome-binding factor A [Aliidiomarina maris]RUO24220.1 ribosome-binding factor A [Aliidiomarina maris]
MGKEFSRTDRFSQQLQREVAQIIQREIKDPRVVMPTVSDVEVSKDLAYAKVFVTFLNDDADSVKEALKVLNDANGFIRSLLGKRLKARITPNLRFEYDPSLNEGIRMARLVNEATQRDAERKKQSGQTDDE